MVEVAHPGPDGDSLRGLLELKDLSRLLGGGPEVRPGSAVVLDVSPTLALRIRRVVEVADVAQAPLFLLPPTLQQGLAPTIRSALLHGERLYLEVSAEAVPHAPVATGLSLRRTPAVLEQVPERALIFESQGRLFGIPLSLVSQVVTATLAFCRFPGEHGPVAGLYPHAQALWPIYSAPALLGGSGAVASADACHAGGVEPLFIFTELAGQGIGFCASRVLGIHQGFVPARAPGEFGCERLPAGALFLDLQHMFS